MIAGHTLDYRRWSIHIGSGDVKLVSEPFAACNDGAGLSSTGTFNRWQSRA